MTSRRAAGNQDALGQSDSRDSTGDEHFDQLTDRIRATSFGRMFPDDAPAKILRRGLLACAPDKGCTMTLMRPDDATPVK